MVVIVMVAVIDSDGDYGGGDSGSNCGDDGVGDSGSNCVGDDGVGGLILSSIKAFKHNGKSE